MELSERTPYELVYGQPPQQNIFPGVDSKGQQLLEEELEDLIEESDLGKLKA